MLISEITPAYEKQEEISVLITRETDYALRILRALSDGKQKNTAEICKAEMISQQFAYKIIKKLKTAGFIQITRGTDGGCRLSADLKEISLFELIQRMDGRKEISVCMNEDFHCERHTKQTDACHIHAKLVQVQQVLDEELKKHTLYEMLCIK